VIFSLTFVNPGGLYSAPIFHMESIWNPYGFHVIPGGFHPFHMEYALAGLPLILVIPFHFYSIWNPPGMVIFHHHSIIPYGMSMWNPHGMTMDSRWIPPLFHGMTMDSRWIPPLFHGMTMDSTWNKEY